MRARARMCLVRQALLYIQKYMRGTQSGQWTAACGKEQARKTVALQTARRCMARGVVIIGKSLRIVLSHLFYCVSRSYCVLSKSLISHPRDTISNCQLLPSAIKNGGKPQSCKIILFHLLILIFRVSDNWLYYYSFAFFQFHHEFKFFFL